MKAGLEVHQQLATGKLFCDCPSDLSENVVATARRRLRATGGENHAVDSAAAFQAARNLDYLYESTSSNCLVELDEEPPHELNPEALEVALTVSALVHARPVDENEVMRKIVVDGSNPSGFQRTALVAVDGHLDVGGHRYSIATVCLEEDAARKVGEATREVRYRLDRLGVPLIEIATGPEIGDGAEARAVAEEIGMLLRSTGKVRRGIGSIREDLNVSVEGGARVEIKGVQELRLVERYVALEAARQRALLQVRDALQRRSAAVPDEPPTDVTVRLRSVSSGPIHAVLRGGGIVLATRLDGFAGLLAAGDAVGPRLGRELADHGRAGGLRGLLHSDELPGLGIDAELLARLREDLGAREPDAIVLLAAPTRAQAEAGVVRIRLRAAAAIAGIPGETRDPLPDGQTRYSRPLPGRDRMYPETDIPPLPVGAERLAAVAARLPERPEAARARLAEAHGLPVETLRQIQREDRLDLFEDLTAVPHPPAAVARLLTQEIPALENELPGARWDRVDAASLDRLLRAVEGGQIAKEAIRPVLSAYVQGAASLDDAIRGLGLAPVAIGELQELAERVVRANAPLIAEKGAQSFQPLMGDLMKEVRGRIDGKTVAEALRAALARHAGSAG